MTLPETYHAMQLTRPGQPLEWVERPLSLPTAGEILIKVSACGVCRTDLHLVDGELEMVQQPIVPGHEIVGRVAAVGAGVTRFVAGQRVGIPWLGWTCGACEFCRSGQENLCDHARFTGYHRDGGYAEYTLADARYCFALPDHYADAEAAPLLCAGLIGYRALSQAGQGNKLGIYGFGAAAHIVAQIAHHQQRRIFAFTRPGDTAAQTFARTLHADWVGASTSPAPESLDAAILFAPVGALIPAALKAVRKGGCVVCGGIHMSDIPSFPYALLWGERQIRSVANLTRQDGEAFLTLAPTVPVQTQVQTYPLQAANTALADLRAGQVNGAAVLMP